MRHATVALHRKLKGTLLPSRQIEVRGTFLEDIWEDYRLFIILHRNRVDSADAEKDFRESTVRMSDCRASSILKSVPVSEDSKEYAYCKLGEFVQYNTKPLLRIAWHF